MKAVVLFVWLFLNLGFFGMCGYIYLIWAQNWRSNARHFYNLAAQSTYDPKDPVIFYEPQRKGTISKRRDRTPRTNTNHNRKMHNQDEPPIDKVKVLKNDILLQMRRVLHDESSVFKTDNPYRVNYRGSRVPLLALTSTDVRCLIKQANVRTLKRTDPPFDHLSVGLLMGQDELFQRKLFKSCAVVSNAASLLDSGLGYLIDSHDVVVRFNHAPTENYEKDVGSKTTVRIVNSQVVTKPEYSFTSDDLYKNVTVIVWDPSDYSASLKVWYNKPDFDFFKQWAQYRQDNLMTESAVIDPRSVWRLWDVLQRLTLQRIRRNPPSSGFLGLTLMLSHCEFVDMMEFVPSVRMTDKCHYFDDITDASCTLGVWHPLAAEKLVTLAMNELNDSTVFLTGFTRIMGFRNLEC